MNNAGRSVAAAYRKVQLVNTNQVLVIHDDLELPVGKVKLRTMGRGKYVIPPFILLFDGVNVVGDITGFRVA